MISLIIAF